MKFVVSMSEAKMAEAERAGFYKIFKLEAALNTSNLVSPPVVGTICTSLSLSLSHTHTHTHTLSPLPQVLFDSNGCLKKYFGVLEILQEFYEVRLDLYRQRKEWLVGQLTAESSKLSSQARFIVEKIEGKIVIGQFVALSILFNV